MKKELGCLLVGIGCVVSVGCSGNKLKGASMVKEVPVSQNSVITVAKTIAQCDFRTTVSLYANGNGPWIITVGESTWQRHMVVEQINKDGTDAILGILTPAQSAKFGFDINTKDVESRTTLRELVANSYASVTETLMPKKIGD